MSVIRGFFAAAETQVVEADARQPFAPQQRSQAALVETAFTVDADFAAEGLRTLA